jgi:hypothetical protein
MLVNENALIMSEQTDKNVGIKRLSFRWCEVYRLGVEIPVLGWAAQRGSTGITPLRSENPVKRAWDKNTDYNMECDRPDCKASW